MWWWVTVGECGGGLGSVAVEKRVGACERCVFGGDVVIVVG